MLPLQLVQPARSKQPQAGDLQPVGSRWRRPLAQPQHALSIVAFQQAEVFVSVAVGDDIAYVVLQGLQGRQELEERLLVEQRGQGDVHGDGVLGVHAGHAHGRMLLGEDKHHSSEMNIELFVFAAACQQGEH